MTNAEAIEILKERRMCAAYVDSEYVDSVDIEAIDIAISALEKQAQEKPLTVLPCGDDVTLIKCTGLKCPMQAGKVDPATCKAADTCKWVTRLLTNADKIAAGGGAAIIKLFDESYYGCPPGERCANRYWLDAPKKPCGKTISCRICWLDYLRQEVSDNG